MNDQTQPKILTRCLRVCGLALALVLGMTFAQDRANAQVMLGVQGEYNLDAPTDDGLAEGAFGLGAQAHIPLARLPIVINPRADYYFTGIEDANVMQFDANVLYPFGVDNALFTPYAGIGLAVTRASFERDVPAGGLISEEGTDIGANLIGGAIFGFGAVRPFVDARITFGNHLAYMNTDGDGGPGYALMGGLLFRLGR